MVTYFLGWHLGDPRNNLALQRSRAYANILQHFGVRNLRVVSHFIAAEVLVQQKPAWPVLALPTIAKLVRRGSVKSNDRLSQAHAALKFGVLLQVFLLVRKILHGLAGVS